MDTWQWTILIVCLVQWTSAQCPKGKWRCGTGDCLDSVKVCDGLRDCVDGSDETFHLCARQEFTCPEFSFRCSYGACVDGDAVCNGLDDCVDRSDELQPNCLGVKLQPDNHNCNTSDFACFTRNQCIKKDKVCDGNADCDDGSDETILQCSSKSCMDFAFRCAYGACVDGDAPCDGTAQCNDGSDETAPQCILKDTGTLSTPGVTKRPPLPHTPPSVKPQGGSANCRLPDFPQNGFYDLYSCLGDEECSFRPGALVRNRFILHYSCNDGYRLVGNKAGNEFVRCQDGIWSPNPPICSNECEPLVSEKLVIKCQDGNKNWVPCNQKMAPNSSATFDCEPVMYRKDSILSYDTIYCKNGFWDPPLRDSFCVIACGRAEGFAAPFIGGGELADPERFPWHAAIYEMVDNKWEQRCAGSLINHQVMISAAHCFAVETDRRDIKKKDESSVKVAMGKYYRKYNAKEDDEFAQFFDVKKILLHWDFKGRWGKYADDIAIVVLNGYVKYTRGVRPVCLLLDEPDEESKLLQGPAGEVVGWGKTDEFNDGSEELRFASIPIVRREECTKKINQKLYDFVTKDKMCGIDKATNQTVCEGDSGGGYVFYDEETRQYTLRGVVSTGDAKCSGLEHVLFTRISHHAYFIRDQLKQLGLSRDVHSH